MLTPLIAALQKAQPIITKTTLKVMVDDLSIPLKKKEFVSALLTEYRSLLEAEAEDLKSGVLFDTDFAGNGLVDGPEFVIQDNGTDKNEERIFAFIAFYPKAENEQKEESNEEDIPPYIEKVVTWDELKAWVEFVLVASDKLKDILAMEDEVQKEYEKSNEEAEDDETITSVEIGDISIYPSSSVEHRAMWIENTKDNISIQIAFEDLNDISYYIDNLGVPPRVHSVYRDSTDEYVDMSWGKKNLKLTFVQDGKKATVKLSHKKAEKLNEKMAIIQENGHLM